MKIKETWPKIKDHYEEDYEDELKNSKLYQNAKENYALVIANSDYAKDPIFASLPRAANDARTIRSFLLQSKVKFAGKNIAILIDASRQAIVKAIDDIYWKARKRGLTEKIETNVFFYYQGHGVSFENET